MFRVVINVPIRVVRVSVASPWLSLRMSTVSGTRGRTIRIVWLLRRRNAACKSRRCLTNVPKLCLSVAMLSLLRNRTVSGTPQVVSLGLTR